MSFKKQIAKVPKLRPPHDNVRDGQAPPPAPRTPPNWPGTFVDPAAPEHRMLVRLRRMLGFSANTTGEEVRALGLGAMAAVEEELATLSQQELVEMATAVHRLVALLLAELAQLIQLAQYRALTGWDGTMLVQRSMQLSAKSLAPSLDKENAELDTTSFMQHGAGQGQGPLKHIDFYFNIQIDGIHRSLASMTPQTAHLRSCLLGARLTRGCARRSPCRKGTGQTA